MAHFIRFPAKVCEGGTNECYYCAFSVSRWPNLPLKWSWISNRYRATWLTCLCVRVFQTGVPSVIRSVILLNSSTAPFNARIRKMPIGEGSTSRILHFRLRGWTCKIRDDKICSEISWLLETYA